MAGQPHEPWQSYSPPPADNQDAYTYPQPGGQGGAAGGGQAYARPAPGYPGSSGAPGYPGSSEAPGYPGSSGAPGYAVPQDQAPPWQPGPDTQPQPQPQPQARARAAADANGFFGSLFDFSFSSFVTPKIIKVLYVLYTIWVIVWAVIFLRLGFKYGGVTGGFFTLLVIDPIFLLLTLGAYRVVLELFMVIHRMHDDLRAIRRQGDERG